MRVVLDGRQMGNREAAHLHLQERLGLPEWYGRNLDALYDCLTGELPPMEILLQHSEALEYGYGQALLDTLREAADEVEGVAFQIVD